MPDAGATSSEPLGPSVCDVCQGLCDMNNPRGVVFSMPDGDNTDVYCYTYIHHANLKALFVSADAGCTTCKVMSDRFREGVRGAARKVSEDIEQTVADESAQRNSGAHTVQTDEDIAAAIRLAELVKREQLHHKRDLSIHDPGRIFVQWSGKNKSDLASTVVAGLDAFVSMPATAASTCPEKSAHTVCSEDSASSTCSDDWARFDCPLQCLITPCDPIDPNLEHRPSKDLLSEAHIDLINRWRHKCEAEHESCRKTAYDQLLPSRVLELLDPNDEKKGVRLIETGRNMQGKYACLSYCWGSLEAQIGQTTHDNLSQYLQSIPFDELPPTVIDTILLCFKLGYQFLWVDRLCIVQDDPKDWSEEASRMSEVYSRSALTVSVPLCDESSQSFLSERLEGFWEEDKFIIIKHRQEESKPRSSAWVYHENPSSKSIEKRIGPWFLEDDWKEFRGRWKHPRKSWLERGWTYQEWLLSPRVLHIDSMTLWDCFSGYANELNERYMGHPYLVRNPDEIEKDSGLTWIKLVEEYSQRKITQEGDRLPALAGLAARHAQATGGTYLAGLWRKNLHWWLLWKPLAWVYPYDNQTAPNLHAPSWSWASLGRKVVFRDPSFMFETDASFLSIVCQYDPPDSLSTVQKAWIDIECDVSAVTEQIADGDQRRMQVKAADSWWCASPDYRWEDLGDLIGRGKIYMLHLQPALTMNTAALLLQEHGWEDGLQCFQRMGHAHLKGPGDWDPWDLPVREDLPIHGDTRRIVRLV